MDLHKNNEHMTADEQAGVAELAFSIWLQEGRPQGRDFDNWLQAEAVYAAKKRNTGTVPGSRGTTAPASPPMTPTPGRQAESSRRSGYGQQYQRESMKVPEARGY